MKNLKILALVVLFVLSFKYVGGQTNTFQSPRYLSLSIDNDQFTSRDRSFTGGLKLSWMSKPLKNVEQKSWLSWIPFMEKPGPQRAISLSLGQNVYTPDDLTAIDLIKDDRPYAGILYLSLGIHSRTHHVQDFLEFTIGIVGPASGAEQMQRFIHDLFGGVIPKGWQNQLKNELVLSWVYERKWKILSRGRTEKAGFDVIPHVGGGMGNLHTYASGGVQVRWGKRLPNDFGGFIARPGGFRNLGYREDGARIFYLYGGVTGTVVLRNIFLDGNLYTESHKVERYPLTADVFLGVSLRVKKIHVSLEYAYWTKRYQTETKNHIFGSLGLIYSY